jgi:hypothetical protein
MFNFYIAKASASFGVTATRDIYEKAIEVLPDRDARTMCLKYADIETKLGEIDRARAVFGHAAQFADPRVSLSEEVCMVSRIKKKLTSSFFSRLSPSGKSGMTLKSNMVMKTPSKRCCVLSDQLAILCMPIIPFLQKSKPLSCRKSHHSF